MTLREALCLTSIYIGGTFIVGALAPNATATLVAAAGWTLVAFGAFFLWRARR